MIETHVARLASLRLPRLQHRKRVPRVTGITRSEAKTLAALFQLGDLGFGLQADLVTATAALHAIGQRHRLPVNGRHRLHRGPRKSVFALAELLELRRVTGGARLRRRNLGLRGVVRTRVLVAVAGRAIDIFLAVLALLPIRDDVRGDLFVAFNT